MDALHPWMNKSVHYNRQRVQEATSRGKLPNFMEGDFDLVTREELNSDETLALRWFTPRRIMKVLSNFVS